MLMLNIAFSRAAKVVTTDRARAVHTRVSNFVTDAFMVVLPVVD
jgi:hypothetical protein